MAYSPWPDVLADPNTLISQTPTRIVYAQSDGTELVIHGTGLSADPVSEELTGGTVTRITREDSSLADPVLIDMTGLSIAATDLQTARTEALDAAQVEAAFGAATDVEPRDVDLTPTAMTIALEDGRYAVYSGTGLSLTGTSLADFGRVTEVRLLDTDGTTLVQSSGPIDLSLMAFGGVLTRVSAEIGGGTTIAFHDEYDTDFDVEAYPVFGGGNQITTDDVDAIVIANFEYTTGGVSVTGSVDLATIVSPDGTSTVSGGFVNAAGVNAGTVYLGGSRFDDTMTLTTGAGNVLWLFGLDGDDDLTATGPGYAFLIGGDGDDDLTGGSGDASYYGGAGDDTAILQGTQAEWDLFEVTGSYWEGVRGGTLVELDSIETVRFAGDGTEVDISNTLGAVQLSDVTVAASAWVQLSTIATFVDADGDALRFFRLWDAEGGDDNFWVDGLGFVDASNGYRLDAAQWGDVWIQGAATGGDQSLWVQVSDNVDGEYSSWVATTLTTLPPADTTAPVVAAFDTQVAMNGWLLLDDPIATYTDAETTEPATITLWDDTGAHSWWVDGIGYVDASSGYTVAGDAAIWVQGEAAPGDQTLWIQASDGTNTSAWASFTLETQSPDPTPPVVAAFDTQVAANGWLLLDDPIATYTDAETTEPVTVTLWDDTGAHSWWVDGIGYVDASSGYTVAGDAAIWVQGEAAPGDQTLWIQASDGFNDSAWASFTLTTQSPDPNAPEILTTDAQVVSNGWMFLDNNTLYVDAETTEPATITLWDDEGADSWWVDGLGFVDASSGYTVAGDALIWAYGDTLGDQTLWVQANDGWNDSAWDSFTLRTTSTNAAPVIDVADQTRLPGEWVPLADVLVFADDAMDAPTAIEIWDDEGAHSWRTEGLASVDASAGAGGYFTVDFEETAFQADADQTLWVRAFDGQAWSEWDSFAITATI
ncbi:MAG: hypothetical protein ACU0CO_04690 [Shimia sp.]